MIIDTTSLSGGSVSWWQYLGRFDTPFGLAVGPAGDKVYVGWSSSILAIDAASIHDRGLVSYTAIGVFQPFSLAVSPDGVTLYAASSSSLGTVSVINTASNAISSTIPVGDTPQGTH